MPLPWSRLQIAHQRRLPPLSQEVKFDSSSCAMRWSPPSLSVSVGGRVPNYRISFCHSVHRSTPQKPNISIPSQPQCVGQEAEMQDPAQKVAAELGQGVQKRSPRAASSTSFCCMMNDADSFSSSSVKSHPWRLSIGSVCSASGEGKREITIKAEGRNHPVRPHPRALSTSATLCLLVLVTHSPHNEMTGERHVHPSLHLALG